VSVRHRHYGIRVTPVPLVTDKSSVPLCRGSCFFGHTAEDTHHLKARIISKDPLFQEEKIPARKRGRCQVNSEKSSKKIISVFGEKPARVLPKPPPTPPRPDSADFTRGENAILGRGTRNQQAKLQLLFQFLDVKCLIS